MIWRTLKRRRLLDATPWFSVWQEEILLEDGETIIPDFYLVDGPEWSSVFALTAEKHVVMLEGYQHGLRQSVLSFPGGLSEGEPPLETAQRELLEETGYTAKEWHSLGRFVLDGNRRYNIGHFFLAQDAQPIGSLTSGDLERFAVRLIPLNTVKSMWLEGSLATVAGTALVGLAFGSGEL